MSTDSFTVILASQFHRWRARRQQVRTMRIVEALPASIRKDIGWRDVAMSRGDRIRGPWSTF